MAEAFLHQLARTLSVPPAEAEAALARIGRHLREQIEATGEAHIEGLGTFRRMADTVAFEPEEALAQAVNHRYAGLPPIEAGVPRRRRPPAAPLVPPPVPEPEPESVEDPFAETTAPELHLPPEPEPLPVRDLAPPAPPVAPEPQPEPEAPPEPEEVEPTPGPVEVEAEAQVAPPAPEPEAVASEADEIPSEDAGPDEIDAMIAGVWTPKTGPEDDGAGIGPMPPGAMEEAEFSLVDEPEAAEPAPTEPEPEPEPEAAPPPEQLAPAVAATAGPERPPEVRRARAQRRPNRGPLIAAAAIVLVVGVAALAWLLGQGEIPESDLGPAAPAETLAAVVPPVDTTADASTPTADTTALAADVPPAPEADEPPPPASADPLRGGDLDLAAGGVTWVVASEASRATAEQKAERYRAQGFRVGIVPGTVRGRTYYRVGLGQFATLDEAHSHRSQLPADVPDSTWPLNL